METVSKLSGSLVNKWLDQDSNPGLTPKFLRFLLYPADENEFHPCSSMARALWEVQHWVEGLSDQGVTHRSQRDDVTSQNANFVIACMDGRVVLMIWEKVVLFCSGEITQGVLGSLLGSPL